MLAWRGKLACSSASVPAPQLQLYGSSAESKVTARPPHAVQLCAGMACRQMQGLSSQHHTVQPTCTPRCSTATVPHSRGPTEAVSCVSLFMQGGQPEPGPVNMGTIKRQLESITEQAGGPARPTEAAQSPEATQEPPQAAGSPPESPAEAPQDPVHAAGSSRGPASSQQTTARPDSTARLGNTARQGQGASTGRSTQGFIRSQVLPQPCTRSAQGCGGKGYFCFFPSQATFQLFRTGPGSGVQQHRDGALRCRTA